MGLCQLKEQGAHVLSQPKYLIAIGPEIPGGPDDQAATTQQYQGDNDDDQCCVTSLRRFWYSCIVTSIILSHSSILLTSSDAHSSIYFVNIKKQTPATIGRYANRGDKAMITLE